jgi:hypothetical protein
MIEVEQPLHYQTACGFRMSTPACFIITGFPEPVALHLLCISLQALPRVY